MKKLGEEGSGFSALLVSSGILEVVLDVQYIYNSAIEWVNIIFRKRIYW